ncbi:hypothetical protein LTR50_006528 [Elasticomyces elasticus]|nr:hypothetical protein LTR50_006528 [Elasticomyces elasticus]
MRSSILSPSRLLRLRTLHPHRTLSSTVPRASSWSPGPAPPRLPKEDQEVFEQLQRQSTGAFSQPRTPTSATDTAPPTGGAPTQRPQINQSPHSEAQAEINAKLEAKGDGGELHPNVRRGAPPEFEGDVNPKTGEVGGPKNEPLRWGDSGDWSYNGRVTDF